MSSERHEGAGQAELDSGRVDLSRFQVGHLDVLRYALAIGLQRPDLIALYREADCQGTSAPVTFYAALGQAAGRLVDRDELAPDGLPMAEDHRGQRLTAGECNVTVARPIRVGEVISVRRSLLGYTRKAGRSGPFVVQRLRRSYADEAGDVVVSEDYSRILR
jgi:hypothetical protein